MQSPTLTTGKRTSKKPTEYTQKVFFRNYFFNCGNNSFLFVFANEKVIQLISPLFAFFFILFGFS
jgi:hypothetical protein